MQPEEKEFKVELKRMFRGYRRVTRKLVQDLQQLGFRLVDSKKHYKIYYRNDSSLSRICSSWAFGSWTAKNIIRSITGTIPVMPSSLARPNPTGGPA